MTSDDITLSKTYCVTAACLGMMESSMSELQEIKSEIRGLDFCAQGNSASTTPQPDQNFQWVSQSFPFFPPTSKRLEKACFVIVKPGKIVTENLENFGNFGQFWFFCC